MDNAVDDGIHLLESRYLSSCRMRGVQPSPSILSSFLKVKHQRLCQHQCILEIIIDQMMYSDFPPLIDALYATGLSGIDSVDVRQESSVVLLIREYVLSLFRVVKEKLRLVDLVDCSFWKDICQLLAHFLYSDKPVRSYADSIISQTKALLLLEVGNVLLTSTRSISTWQPELLVKEYFSVLPDYTLRCLHSINNLEYSSGLTCQTLNLRCLPIRKLKMTGEFMQLHTLNLDFSTSLTSFDERCFSCMPNLMRLSMCETRVTNLWMASAALSKLLSLVELRFQNCSCCFDTGPCPASGKEVITSPNEKVHSGQGHSYSGQWHSYSHSGSPSMVTETLPLQVIQYSTAEETISSFYNDGDSFANLELVQRTAEESSDGSDLDFSNIQQDNDTWADISYSSPYDWDERTNSGTIVSPSNRTMSGSSIQESFHLLEEAIYSNRETKHDIPEAGSLDYVNDSRFNGHDSFGEIYSQFNPRDQLSTSTYTNEGEGCLPSVLNLGDIRRSFGISQERHSVQHPSPICFEKHYREFMISSLPRLKVLDNLPIKNTERDKAKVICKKYYECAPYNRLHINNVANILYKREVGSSVPSQGTVRWKQPYIRESCHSFARSLSSAKVCSAAWPHLHRVSKFRNGSGEETKSFRPRQFEYHPSNPSLMVFGTLDGELVVINHESQKVIGYLPSVGALHSILGLCWLKKHPSKLIAGSDNGSLQLYDVCKMPSTITDRYCGMDAAVHKFDEFEQLTSVHINSSDEYFLASGFSKHVALYDIGSGKRLQIFQDLHQEHINVVKFAHNSPTIFATASFDQEVKVWDLRQGPLHPCYSSSSSRGNVMVCFSPDDHYLLASAIDNEVRQLLAVDGRLHMAFNISPIGSAQNYTRSYYMNGRDYIISGSCEENVVRVCCAQTGRRLRDIFLEGRGSRNSMFVQSLRGDPFRVFHMSILAAYLRSCTKSEIIKVDLLSSTDCIEESCGRCQHVSYGMGG